MHNRSEHTGKITDLERMPSSKNGNPRYSFRIDGWSCCTQPDSVYALYIANYAGNGATVTAVIGTHYGRCQLDSVSKKPVS